MSSGSTFVSTRRRWRRVLTYVAVGVTVAAFTFCAGWAVREISFPVDAVEAEPPTTIPITEGEVGATLTLGASVEWVRSAMPANQATGTVTSLPTTPTAVHEGATLYSVNLRPVVLGTGSVPMFRDLRVGDHGRDVSQLQEMLGRLGFYRHAVDGEMGPLLEQAVVSWQKSLDVDADGIVRLGDIVFVSEAKLTVTAAQDRKTGDRLAGREQVLDAIAPQPRVFLSLTEAQRSLVAQDMRVTVPRPGGGTWEGRIGGSTKPPDGGPAQVAIVGADGAALCGTECGSLNADSSLLATIYQVEPIVGLVVPITALQTNGAGEAFVLRADGSEVVVEVLGTANGMAAIEGPEVAAGDEVVISSDDK